MWYKCKGRGATRQSDNILMTSEAMRATGGNMVFNTMSHSFVKLKRLTWFQGLQSGGGCGIMAVCIAQDFSA